jgi:uncharacterized protein involved in exopolysaccharide biosynthesis
MSVTGVKRSKAIAESETLEPKLAYETQTDWREWQARRFLLLWSLRRVPFTVFLVCVVASVLIPFLIPNSYMATSQLMPPENLSSSNMAMLATLTSKTGPLGSVASDLLNVKTSAGLLIGLLSSQNIMSQMVKQFDLVTVYKVKDEEEAQAKLMDNTSLREDKNSGIISISVTDRDPKRAAAIANAYVERLNDVLAQLSTSSAHRERVFLEERLKLIKQDLDSATNQLAQFSSNTNTLDPQEEGKAMLDAAGNITAQLVASESQLEALRQAYTDRHPRVKALKARVEELRKQLQQLGGASGTSTIQNNKGAADSSDPSSSTAYPTIRSLPLLGARYSDFYRHLKIQESVFELLTSQYELAKVQEAKEIPSVKILDVATPPRKKISSHRALLMLVGIFLSLGAASACWFLAMLWHGVDPLDPRVIVVQDLLGQFRSVLPSPMKGSKESDAGPEAIVSQLRKGHVSQNDETSRSDLSRRTTEI